MRVGFKSLILALALAIPAIASAEALQLDAIRAEQATIRAGVESHRSGRYKELPEATRTELLARQATMLELIDGKQSGDQLTEAQRAEVTTTLAWIDAKLKEADDERMVCERRKTIGSNRRERVCMTAAQMREQREATRDNLDRRGICADCSGR
jgi:hypothetical protein